MGVSLHSRAPVLTNRRTEDMIRLVLASSSPRRRELLAQLDVPFTIVTTDAEDRDDPVPPEVIAALPPCPVALTQHPTLRAWRKAHAVWSQGVGDVVLGADTTVVLDDLVLEKPRDSADACKLLAQLSGRRHTVYTGMCVYSSLRASGQPASPAETMYSYWLDLVASDVWMATLSPETIAAYVETGEPLDKAGAYGIQGIGGQLVRQIHGSYTAVVGLPLPTTRRMLSVAGVCGLKDATAAYTIWLHNQGKEPLPCPPTLP